MTETVTTDAKPRPGLTPERVSMFTDAVLAIAITLLALEIPRPGEKDLEHLDVFLSERSSGFLSFALAFVLLWFAWRAHHQLFDQLKQVSQVLLAVHVPLLLFAAFLPYATHLIGEAEDAGAGNGKSIAVGMFSATEGVLMVCLGLLFAFAAWQRLYADGSNVARIVTSAVVNGAIGLWWWIAAAVSFAGHADVAMLIWWLTPVLTVVVVFTRRAMVKRR